MNEHDLLMQAVQIDTELKHEGKRRGIPAPIWWIIGSLLAILIVLMIVPGYIIKIDPQPARIPSIAEVMPQNLTIKEGVNHSVSSHSDFIRFIKPSDQNVKFVANKISTIACNGERVCEAKAIFYFVRDNFKYAGDPSDDYVETFEESMLMGSSDCDGHSVMLANLMEAIGIEIELVFVPEHVFARISLPEAAKKYKTNGDYVYLDPTCADCAFGEITKASKDLPMSFVKV